MAHDQVNKVRIGKQDRITLQQPPHRFQSHGDIALPHDARDLFAIHNGVARQANIQPFFIMRQGMKLILDQFIGRVHGNSRFAALEHRQIRSKAFPVTCYGNIEDHIHIWIIDGLPCRYLVFEQPHRADLTIAM